jgi:hypothetical protein
MKSVLLLKTIPGWGDAWDAGKVVNVSEAQAEDLVICEIATFDLASPAPAVEPEPASQHEG